MKLTPYKKKKLLWTLIMLPFVLADTALMATGVLGKTWGGIIFIVIMLIAVYGNYRIDKKHNAKEAVR